MTKDRLQLFGDITKDQLNDLSRTGEDAERVCYEAIEFIQILERWIEVARDGHFEFADECIADEYNIR